MQVFPSIAASYALRSGNIDPKIAYSAVNDLDNWKLSNIFRWHINRYCILIIVTWLEIQWYVSNLNTKHLCCLINGDVATYLVIWFNRELLSIANSKVTSKKPNIIFIFEHYITYRHYNVRMRNSLFLAGVEHIGLARKKKAITSTRAHSTAGFFRVTVK